MPQPNSSPKIVSPPAAPGMPYDPTDGGSGTAPWKKLDANAGAASIHTGRVTQPYDDDGHGWRQT